MLTLAVAQFVFMIFLPWGVGSSTEELGSINHCIVRFYNRTRYIPRYDGVVDRVALAFFFKIALYFG